MNDWEIKLKKKFGEKIQKSVLMKHHTTIGVGGICDFFFGAKTVNELVEVASFAYYEKIPFIIIGWGSNIVVSDFGYNGLVIKNESTGVVVNKDRGEIIAESGISTNKMLNLGASNNLGGVEFLAGIPGTIAGAVNNNSGSKTVGIGDFVKSVTCLEEKQGGLKIISHDHKWMEFKYRDSKLKSGFKDKKCKPVILSVTFRLARKRKEEITRLIAENLSKKIESQPLSEKTAGSYFKNAGALPEQSAGYLLDHSGAKKLKHGGARVSSKHANFIVNYKNASADDIRRLAEMMRDAVKNSYHIILEEEVEYIGKW